MERNRATLHGLPPREIHAQDCRHFFNTEKAEQRVKLSEEGPTPIGWWIKNVLHMIGFPLLALLLLPMLILP